MPGKSKRKTDADDGKAGEKKSKDGHDPSSSSSAAAGAAGGGSSGAAAGGGGGASGGGGGGGGGEERRRGRERVARVPLTSLRASHILSKTEYLRVLEVSAADNKCRVQVLRGDKPDDVWEITTPEALLACSTEFVQKTERVTKTELAQRLVDCKDDAFKVVFRPVLTAELLFDQLKAQQKEIAEAKTDAALKKIAKKLMEIPEKTLKGRLISPNTVLGYSLLDDLDQTDTQKVAFRNVSHNTILSLTVGGIQYALK